jgi:hypothetical protein
MDKDLKKLIAETIKQTFAEAPEKLVERGTREIQYDICPHCKTEIYEKHEYTEDGGVTWRHSDCKGLIARPETPLEEVNQWLRPYVEEARNQRHAARKELGYAPLPSDEPGGTMAAVNTTGLATEIGGRTSDQEKDPYGKSDDESGTPPPSPDNDPISPEYDPTKPTVLLHPHPDLVPKHGVNETELGKSEREESKPVAPRDYVRFVDSMMNFVNASNIPLKVTVTEFSVMADKVHSVKTYIVRVDNG